MAPVQVRAIVDVCALARMFLCSSYFFVSLKPTFGRWSYKSGKPFFVAGSPPPSSEHKQPALELFSWKRFVDDGKDVRIVI